MAKKKIVAKVGGKIADGKGGYFAKGDELPSLSKEQAESLEAKDLI